MTIATKNGSVIIKDGSVAQNCGCCECTPFIAISIIDEDDGYFPARRRDDDWNCFRAAYPSSPFFLLVPKIINAFGVQLPAAWDGQKYDVSRDNGIAENATDYYNLLGLESLLAQYDRIVLVVDNSGSMNSGTVQASLDMLYSQLESQHGMNEANGSLVRIDFFSENWIDPFASICKTPSGAIGACCGLTCSVKPQCQCNAAAGEVFRGVGTVCSPNPCQTYCADGVPSFGSTQVRACLPFKGTFNPSESVLSTNCGCCPQNSPRIAPYTSVSSCQCCQEVPDGSGRTTATYTNWPDFVTLTISGTPVPQLNGQFVLQTPRSVGDGSVCWTFGYSATIQVVENGVTYNDSVSCNFLLRSPGTDLRCSYRRTLGLGTVVNRLLIARSQTGFLQSSVNFQAHEWLCGRSESPTTGPIVTTGDVQIYQPIDIGVSTLLFTGGEWQLQRP